MREVLLRAGCMGEKVCFIFDESNVLESSFLERMNALLACGEVPGLFEGEELAALLAQCREAATRATDTRTRHASTLGWGWRSARPPDCERART